MSGPALRNKDSHTSIHEAAIHEAQELTDLLDHLLKDEKDSQALEVAYILVEHWETRTLTHAESEEEGLYSELVTKSPELKETIIALSRDHQLLRLLMGEIKHLLASARVNQDVMKRFHAMIIVDLLHNQDEMKLLL
ncbi:hemerythrin domain-containing protein [Neobacillus sp. PS3-40]|jgi:hypothetical protein|uniref:hemerythrin domain-containing protein n=1 Tax=Neobacillus sp. PS3-40 TaxID=3070679 RepID=UPI0027E155BA|nr:hemerythrin domain-containing protein [Neobacillus sp. PS3-40]WML44411.1 hemerythrin domain-containing protein [Neobacillus sp. PS3-40]